MRYLESSHPIVDRLAMCLSTLCWFIYPILLFGFAYMREFPLPYYILLNLSFFMFLQVLLTVVHEKAHAYAASCFSFKTEISYRNKDKKHFRDGQKFFKPCCLFEGDAKIGKIAFVTIAIAPAITLSLIFLLFLLLFKTYLSQFSDVFYFGALLYLIKLRGCSGDISLIIGALKQSKGVKFQQLDAGNFRIL
ncbi:metalloprotease family protein [Bacillus inaquosorum]|uniref:metalloprotease family protein n=1 Tax=Bacillus inaquosorum TaxID=483913 RepID=UPI00227DD56C|nr:metalloprotease family protein [Bacillus inaquosorum]MCY8797784.1 metalloprotease family protein [Bacillus inaquosorum]MEC0769204.1 metalloprotease family protein [Bacillus inaquosorum]MEC0794834.1 metalloprotease family protein [Bacillus inaquosorum]MED1542112.1 metalloprotease family protein [Bacillus inaquosorum]